MAEQPSPTWNFKTGGAREMAFFKRGELMIMEAKEQYKGELKGLKFQKKADKTALKEERKKGLLLAVGAKAKAQVNKKYQTDLAALNKQYKKSFDDLRIERKENIAAGKAATEEAFKTGYLPPSPTELAAPDFTSEYAQEAAQIAAQSDAEAEGIPTFDTLLAGIQESMSNLTGQLSTETLKSFDIQGKAFESITDQLDRQKEAFGSIITQAQKTDSKTESAIRDQIKRQTDIASKERKQQDEISKAQLDAQEKLSIEERKQQKQIAIDQAKLFKEIEDSRKVQSKEQFDKQYALSKLSFEEQQKTLLEQLGIQQTALEQESQFQEDYLTRLREQETREAQQFETESAQFAAQFGLQEEAVGLQRSQIAQQEAIMQQQKDLAEAQRRQEEAAYERQLTRFRNQARENLTPELQIQPGAQGLNIGGTSMFKRPGVRVRTAEREQIIPKNTLGITQQSATNSLNIA